MERKFIKRKVQEVVRSARIDGIGDSVLFARSIPTSVDELPIALVYIDAIDVEKFDEAPKSYLKALHLTIEIVSQDNTGDCLSDELDDIALKVEKAIEGSVDLERKCEAVILRGVNYSYDGDGDTVIGSAKVNYTFSYIENAKETDIVLPDLKTIHTTTKINGNEQGASDTIEL